MDVMGTEGQGWSCVYSTSVPYRVDLPGAGPGVSPAISDAALDRLIELGALDVDVSPNGGTAALMPDSVTPEQITRALGTAVLEISPAVGRDAQSVWVLRLRPVHVGGLRIVPAHMDAEPGAIRLIDAPAFGTGMHPTTGLCIETLSDMAQGRLPDAVLDVGTGSGVLALAALTLGVRQALGIDIDDEALGVAAENARLNGFDQRLQLAHGGPQTVTGTWPLVLANLLAAPLIEMAPSLVQRIGHHGRLVLSGIPRSVEREVDQAYRHLGMRRLAAQSREGWIVLVLQASW
jgi:ribosomal protein L11 methyltransferase